MSECDNLCGQSELQEFVFMMEQNKLIFMETGELAVIYQLLFLWLVEAVQTTLVHQTLKQSATLQKTMPEGD